MSYNYTKYVKNFVPTTILGKRYEPYDRYRRGYTGLLKLTGRLADNLRLSMMGQYKYSFSPHAGAGPFTTADYTDRRKYPSYIVTGILSWFISTDTILEVKGGHNMIKIISVHQPGAENNYTYYDNYTGYSWGGRHREEEVIRWSWQANTHLTHFEDDFLGGSHEMRAGLELFYGVSDWFI